MNNVSFIIAIDSSYEMTTNFFETFINNSFVKSSEIIIVNDCINNIKTLNYLNQIKCANNNIKLIDLDIKVGYGRANNIGVEKSTKDYLFFINTDVFVEKNCFELMYEYLEQNTADCVQPLLLWPQNNRIQCAGSFFGPYFKNHLFAGRRIESIDLAKIPKSRQALTSALYAMKKDTFVKHGGFDEFYYNKLESFELSFKLSLAGKKCICATEALAYHSQGAGRNQYYFDFRQQEVYFWTHMGNKIIPDICKYYELQISEKMRQSSYTLIAIAQTREVKKIVDSLGITICAYIEINGIDPRRINLYDLLPYSVHNSISPIIFFVENITNLSGNLNWFEQRKQEDVVMDTYGNLLYAKKI